MKREEAEKKAVKAGPAAFGRLCVETLFSKEFSISMQPAAFGRLCVETV